MSYKNIRGLGAAAAISAVAFGLLAATSISATADAPKDAPAPFNKPGVKLALISYLSEGDFFQAYGAGAQAQAKALGVDLRIFQGRQNADEERSQVEQAINLGVKGIIIDHGQPEALKDVAQKALDAGIKVVAFDVNLDNPKIPQVEQSDHDLATLVLGQAVKENGDKFVAGEVYVAGFAPLDRRNEVWQAFKKEHAGVSEKAVWGAVDATTAKTVADQTAAVFHAHPDIKVVFAPYDEFARGVKLAADENKLKVKIYSADISTSDIEAIRADDSPWVATAATNPAVVGEVSVRALALAVAGTDPGHEIVVKPALVTHDELVKNDIKTVADLVAKVPSFSKSDAAQAKWIPVPKP
ncbi:MAG TPA: substrate-binding domain-containing protein [Magnetospirillaceae bacterium]|jgi:simple sugar transport system substrate-binding protein